MSIIVPKYSLETLRCLSCVRRDTVFSASQTINESCIFLPDSKLSQIWSILYVLIEVILISVCGMVCRYSYLSGERWDMRKYWEISLTLKQPRNLSLFILPPVNVKYYCLFQSWHALTKSTRGLSFNCCSLHSAVKWLISKAKVSCTEGQMYWLCSFTCAVIYIRMESGD